MEATRQFVTPEHTHPHLVICGVKNERALEREARKLEAQGIEFATFNEPDRGNELTAIATAPIAGEKRRAFRRHNLLQQKAFARGPP